MTAALSTPGTNDRAHAVAYADVGHWDRPLSGHGLAYFRDLAVDYQTLEWSNPHAVAVSEAQKAVDENAKALAQARELPTSDESKAPVIAKLEQTLSASARTLAEIQKKQDAAATAHQAADGLAKDLIAKVAADRGLWRHILEFESVLLRLLPLTKLEVRYASLADEFQGVTGNPAPPAPADETELRALAGSILTDLHWAYTTLPIQEDVKSRMLVSLSWVLALVVSAGCLATSYINPIFGWVIIAGGLGASLSAYQRVQSRKVKGDALTSTARIESDKKWMSSGILEKLRTRVAAHGSFALAPAIGALSAVMLAFLFAGGVVKGSIFPTLTVEEHRQGEDEQASKGGNVSPATFPSETKPAESSKPSTPSTSTSDSKENPAARDHAAASETKSREEGKSTTISWPNLFCWDGLQCSQLALMLVWTFIAGFSERLVPDIVSRLSKTASGAQ